METRPQSIVDALKRPDEPWELSRYMSKGDAPRAELASMTSEEIMSKPFECGILTSQKSRALAVALGFTVETSQSHQISFGFIPPKSGTPPIAIITGAYGSPVFWRSNVALTHVVYLYLQAITCDCCDVENLYIPPQHVELVANKVRQRGSMANNPHWWQSTVWARAYHGMNAIYGNEGLANAVRAEDERRGFWFPDLADIGNDRRLEKIWKGEIQDRVATALSSSPSPVRKE